MRTAWAAFAVAGPMDAMLPEEDQGIIHVGQLSRTGALYALPQSFYDYDQLGAGPDCGPGQECTERSLPASAWSGDEDNDKCDATPPPPPLPFRFYPSADQCVSEELRPISSVYITSCSQCKG